MFHSRLTRASWLVIYLTIVSARASSWNYWVHISIPNMQLGTQSAQLATDRTQLYYSTLVDGVYRAALADHQFTAMPLTGFPLWDASVNTNGYAVWHIHVAPHGTLLLSGSPVNISNRSLSSPPSPFYNTLPPFYWWDETNQVWQAAAIACKTYPYTTYVGNFCNAPDGSVWTCSGWASYAYRSTDDGHSYTAFDINARVPANYFPLPFTTDQLSFGKIFSIVAGPHNEVVIGTETGGYLHSANNGTNWTSLDPDYTDPNSVNPLGRIGDALIAGLDRYGNFLCKNIWLGQVPGYATWGGVSLIGWHPADGSLFNAASGFPPEVGPGRVLTTAAGVSFTFMNQGTNLLGGIYVAPEGKSWSQNNTNIPGLINVSPNVGDSVIPGGCLTTLGNLVFIGTGNTIYTYDSTPPPITNRPPVALPQNVNLWENIPTNLTLTGSDADGDALNFTLVTQPRRGTLTGTPPDLIYTPANNSLRLDSFSYLVDDGIATSAPVAINLVINATTNPLSNIAFTSPLEGRFFIEPANVTLTVAADNLNGINSVSLYSTSGTNLTALSFLTNAPYTYVLTNQPVGDNTFSAMATDNHGARTWSTPVRIFVLPVAPNLTLQPVDSSNVAVTWPLSLAGFYLESATEMCGPWTLSPVQPILYETNQTVTLPLADLQFFRLMRP